MSEGQFSDQDVAAVEEVIELFENEIIPQMCDLITLARSGINDLIGRGIISSSIMASADAYIFNQLNESVENSNPYNQSLTTLVQELKDEIGC